MNSAAEIEIFSVTPADVDAVRKLLREYAAGININLCFQNFEHELISLPGSYAPPHGRLFLACAGHQHAGCIALRPMGDGVAEIKRLYVRPAFRRRGLGRMLVQRALSGARDVGYRTVRLDTLREMKPAIALYASFGFEEVAPYRPGEPPGICYFELKLTSR